MLNAHKHMTHILTLIPRQGTFRRTFPPSMPTQFFIQTVCTQSKHEQNLLPTSHQYFNSFI